MRDKNNLILTMITSDEFYAKAMDPSSALFKRLFPSQKAEEDEDTAMISSFYQGIGSDTCRPQKEYNSRHH